MNMKQLRKWLKDKLANGKHYTEESDPYIAGMLEAENILINQIIIATMEKIKDDDCMIPIEEFIDAVKCRGFIDYDGFGYLANKHAKDQAELVIPSEVATNGYKIDTQGGFFTHVVWYNR